MDARLSSLITNVKSIRKSAPLPMRRGWGLIKRQFTSHRLWDSKEFQKYFDFLQKSQWWSSEELEAYQLEQLKELVKFAYEKVPYYRRSFHDKRLDPSDIKSLDDLQLLPLITKQEVRDHIDEFIPIGVDRCKLKMWVTGGTSGIPLSIYLDDFYCSMIEEAFRLRQWMWAGYQQYDRRVTLQREAVKSFRINKCWDYNNHENDIVLSSRDMTEEHMFEYIAVINKFKPRFITGYPSALEIFTKFLDRNNLSLPPIRAIFSETEALFPGQRALIERIFNSKIFAGYGMSERIADATECEQHTGYHISSEYGIFELLNKDLETIHEPGVAGVVVGTGFHNNVMPLIRYQMFDVAVYSEEKCPCQRNLPLIKSFKGRFREYFVGRSGKLVPLQLVWSGRHPVWSKIREMKYYQQREGEVLAKIVRAPKYPVEEVTIEFQEEVKKILTEDEFNVQFEFVDGIPLTHRGKLNFLEQKIAIDFDDISNA